MLKIVPKVIKSKYAESVITQHSLIYEVRVFGWVILRTPPVHFIACEAFVDE